VFVIHYKPNSGAGQAVLAKKLLPVAAGSCIGSHMVHTTSPADDTGNSRTAARAGADAMVRFIIQSIDQGAWMPGQKLPTERDLATRFRISRNTLRKHLDVLEASGRIARQVGSGTYVAEPRATQGNIPAPSAPADLIRRIHGASPAEVMEFRLLIEPQMAELAVTRATADDLRDLEEDLRRGEDAVGIAEFEYWDGALHLTLLRCARNQLVTDLYAAINGVREQALWGRMKERSLTPERRRRYEQQHRSIVDALRDRDISQTREHLRIHLVDVRDSLLGG
jgi:DNA-binding FadR family transcriptional regulator